MGLKVREKKKIAHFSFIKITRMYNYNLLKKKFGFMDILHINKPKKKHFKTNIL